MGVVGYGGKGGNSGDTMLETGDLVKAMLDGGGVSAKEPTRDLDTIKDDSGEIKEWAVGVGGRRIRREEQLALVGVAKHSNGIAEGIIAEEEFVHEEVLSMPPFITVGDKEAGHIISEGFDDMVREFNGEVAVHEVVEGNVKAGRAKDTARACAFSAEGDMVELVAFIIVVLVEAWSRRAVIRSEKLVGLGPMSVNTV